GLKDQIRRSSLGVMNNISEGFEQRTVKIFIDYLGRAKGSCGETRSMLYVALDCNYISKVQFEKMYNSCLIISKKTRKLMSYLENYDSNNRIEETIIKYGN
ncbi:MAG: four helix bundle protein, partial [Balneolaceae bacterium]